MLKKTCSQINFSVNSRFIFMANKLTIYQGQTCTLRWIVQKVIAFLLNFYASDVIYIYNSYSSAVVQSSGYRSSVPFKKPFCLSMMNYMLYNIASHGTGCFC